MDRSRKEYIVFQLGKIADGGDHDMLVERERVADILSNREMYQSIIGDDRVDVSARAEAARMYVERYGPDDEYAARIASAASQLIRAGAQEGYAQWVERRSRGGIDVPISGRMEQQS